MIRLYINGQELDVAEDVDFPITFAQADAKKPEARKRSSSKTIVLPGTQNNNRFFLSTYNLKASDVYGDLIGFDYDPTLRYPFIAVRNGKPFFRGSAHLTKVTRQKYEEHGTVNNFHVVLYSEIVDMFQALGDIKVNELGWSAYDHVLSIANIQASWSATTGSGYWYPYVDYGLATDPLSIQTNQLYPHVYVKEIVEKCFAHAGFTLSGSFFSASLYKKLAWGSGGGEPILLDSIEVAARRVNYTGDGTASPSIVYSNYDAFFQITKFDYFIFAPVATLGFITMTLVNDTSLQFDAPSGEIVIENAGYYSLALAGTFPITYTYSDTGLTGQQIVITVQWVVYVNGAVVNTFSQTIIDNAAGSDSIVFAETQELELNDGDIVNTVIKLNTFGSQVGELAISDTLDIVFDLNNTLSQDLTALNIGLIDGDTVKISRFLPEMKAADFLQDMITMFNLYMSDPDEDGNVVLLPQDEYFYGTNDVDQWSDKIARDQPIEIEAAANIEGKRYRFRWAEDRDYYKMLYLQKWGHDYGDYDYNVPSTFKTGDKVYQLKIAQTCPVQIDGTDIIIPRIIQVDPSTQLTKPYKGKPRIYFNLGTVSCDDWDLINSDTMAVTTNTTQPVAHHLDNLTTATFDLNFGKPVEIFYAGTTYTTDNLFSRFHAQFIRELTGRDSKVLNAWFRLNENDFYENFMRRLCNIDGVLYRKNIIKDWIANTNNLIKCELIRIVAGRSRAKYVLTVPQTPAESVAPTVNVSADRPLSSADKSLTVDTNAGDVNLTINTANYRYMEGQSWDITNIGPNNVIISGAIVSGSATQTIPPYGSMILSYKQRKFYLLSSYDSTGGGSGLTHGEVMGRVDLGF